MRNVEEYLCRFSDAIADLIEQAPPELCQGDIRVSIALSAVDDEIIDVVARHHDEEPATLNVSPDGKRRCRWVRGDVMAKIHFTAFGRPL